MQSGHITKGLRPDWEPLVAFVGRDVVGCFAWKFALQLDDGVAVHAYRNLATDGFLLLATDGRSFVYRDADRYEQLSPGMALEAAFAGWEEARPRPRFPDAVRALLERHRVYAADTPGGTSAPPAGSSVPETRAVTSAPATPAGAFVPDTPAGTSLAETSAGTSVPESPAGTSLAETPAGTSVTDTPA